MEDTPAHYGLKLQYQPEDLQKQTVLAELHGD